MAPVPAFPPTPEPSGRIKEQETAPTKIRDQAFTLPPSAVNNGRSPNDNGAPLSPRQSAEHTKPAQADMSLPPPPTRSRKIIQMTPKTQSPQQKKVSSRRQSAADTAPVVKPETSDSRAGNAEAKKKGAANTTAAGRKVARKTAHSIIERRRRSKMNEEFATLKDLIPACAGQEMHKLAILQASIDYLRYLEQCVSDLKTNRGHGSRVNSSYSPPPHNLDVCAEPEPSEDGSDDDMEIDEPPADPHELVRADTSISSVTESTAVTSPAFSVQSNFEFSRTSSIGQPSPSPVIRPYSNHENHHQYSLSSLSQAKSTPRASFSNQTSPEVLPQRYPAEETTDLTEASAALLMLNATDRRSITSNPPTRSGSRGMSVRELLRS